MDADTSRPGAPRMQARTRLARRAVVQAARDLFTSNGYGPTTVDAVSEAAGVAPATVYRLFASKVGVLQAVIDVAIAGDDAEIAMIDRPQVQALLRSSVPRDQLRGFVSVAAQVNARVGPLYRVLVAAAGTDADAAALLDRLTTQRQQGQRAIARSLARSGALRPGLRERDAADIVHTLLSPEVYRLLVVDRGWGVDRYEEWLTATLVDQLLAPL